MTTTNTLSPVDHDPILQTTDAQVDEQTAAAFADRLLDILNSGALASMPRF